MTPAEQYLIEYLEEEFSRFPQIRIAVKKEDSDYGVLVRSESREWFFPFEWSTGPGFSQVHRLVAAIRDVLP